MPHSEFLYQPDVGQHSINNNSKNECFIKLQTTFRYLLSCVLFTDTPKVDIRDEKRSSQGAQWGSLAIKGEAETYTSGSKPRSRAQFHYMALSLSPSLSLRSFFPPRMMTTTRTEHPWGVGDDTHRSTGCGIRVTWTAFWRPSTEHPERKLWLPPPCPVQWGACALAGPGTLPAFQPRS